MKNDNHNENHNKKDNNHGKDDHSNDDSLDGYSKNLKKHHEHSVLEDQYNEYIKSVKENSEAEEEKKATADDEAATPVEKEPPIKKYRRLFSNQSVKIKLLSFNLMTSIIPFICVVLLLLGVLVSFLKFMSGDANRNNKYRVNMGILSAFPVQWNLESLSESLINDIGVKYLGDTGDFSRQNFSHRSLDFCNKLEDSGSIIGVFVDSKAVYLTEGTTMEQLSKKLTEISPGTGFFGASFFKSTGQGIVMVESSDIGTNGSITVVLVNNTMNNVIGSGVYTPGELGVASTMRILFVISILALVLITVIISLLFVKLISRDVLEPIERLDAAAKEMRRGNLDAVIDKSSNDEIGRLSEDFDQMRQQLKFSIETQQEYAESRRKLVAGISHDIATPITTIKGYASGLLDGIANNDEKRKHYYETIMNTANAMDHFVTELSTLSRLDFEKIEYDFRKIDLVKYMNDFVDEKAILIAGKNTEMSFKSEDVKKAFIMVDDFQFTRVLSNIINNSIKYRRSPSITCRIKATLRQYELDPNKVILSVEDNGVGVPEDQLDRIFDIFYRTDNARSNVSGGSGLGLAISYQVINQMNGKIWADRNEYGGLTILILLPLVQ